MSAADDLVRGNERYDWSPHRDLAVRPRLRLAVVTCMDARIEPLAAFGLALGDAHVLRNAGALVTEDVLRSLAVSQRVLGTREIVVVTHTRCGMAGFDDDAFRSELRAAAQGPDDPPWRAAGFADPADYAREALEILRSSPWLVHGDAVRGLVFDVDSGRVVDVEAT